MNRRARSIMMALAALVAGTLLIVYAYRAGQGGPESAEARNEQQERQTGTKNTRTQDGSAIPKGEAANPATEPAPPQSLSAQNAAPEGEAAKRGNASPKPGEAAATAGGRAPEVLYDLNQLPPPIKRTLEHVVVAAQSGNVEEMLPVLEENELPPMLSAAAVSDPIAFWKKASADGEGREILATMLNVFSSGFVRKGEGGNAMYVWPYFAEMDLSTLTPSQEVELYRIVPAALAGAMKKSGKYTYYRAGIGNDGVWHYFMQ
jgi:hypothetical protein